MCIFNRVVYMAFSGLKTLYKDLNEKKEYTEQVFRRRTFQDMGERMNYSISDFGTNEYLFGITAAFPEFLNLRAAIFLVLPKSLGMAKS